MDNFLLYYIMDPENITLKPIPLQILLCSMCRKHLNIYLLRLNGKIYKSCDKCIYKSRMQGAIFRSNSKQLIIDLNNQKYE